MAPNSGDEGMNRRRPVRGLRATRRLLLPGLLCGVLLLCQLNDYPSTIAHNATYISMFCRVLRTECLHMSSDAGASGCPEDTEERSENLSARDRAGGVELSLWPV